MSKNTVLVLLNQSELSHKILPHVERFVSADDNDLILYFVTKPPSAVGFGEPDLAPGYVLPGDSPVTPTLHPIYASQQEDSIRAHVESELIPVVNQLREAGYTVSVDVEFGKDSLEAILREITKSKISLVAMSTRARVGVTRFFFQSIADTIAQKSQVPVLLIHPTGE